MKEKVESLIQQLGSGEASIRRNAAIALGQIGEPAKNAVPALVKALHDEDEDVRFEAVSALKKIGTPEAMKAVEGDENPERK